MASFPTLARQCARPAQWAAGAPMGREGQSQTHPALQAHGATPLAPHHLPRVSHASGAAPLLRWGPPPASPAQSAQWGRMRLRWALPSAPPALPAALGQWRGLRTLRTAAPAQQAPGTLSTSLPPAPTLVQRAGRCCLQSLAQRCGRRPAWAARLEHFWRHWARHFASPAPLGCFVGLQPCRWGKTAQLAALAAALASRMWTIAPCVRLGAGAALGPALARHAPAALPLGRQAAAPPLSAWRAPREPLRVRRARAPAAFAQAARTPPSPGPPPARHAPRARTSAQRARRRWQTACPAPMAPPPSPRAPPAPAAAL